MANAGVEDRSEIVFFDVETTVPTRPGQGYALLEFGAILVCPRKLVELESYSTLILPEDLNFEDYILVCSLYDILHGRIWAGHNILKFDCVRIKEASDETGRVAPKPKGTLDSLAILIQKFGRRAGNMKVKVMDRVHLDTITKKATKKHLETMKSRYHGHLQNGVSSI